MEFLNSDLPLIYTSDPAVNDASLVDDDIDNPNPTTQTDPESDVPLYDPDDVAPSIDGNDLPDGTDNITDPSYYQEPTWCFLESQNWTGVEVEPDCVSDPSNVFCTDSASMERMVMPRPCFRNHADC